MASFRTARAADLAKRTIHVKIYPTARTFAERREVLRVLEQFGEVAMFRSLKYRPRAPVSNAFTTLFNTESAATEALNQSPIRYRLVSQPSQMESMGSTIETPKDSNAEEDKIFELHVSTSNFDHELYLNSPSTNPLHGPFVPVSPTRSYIAGSLDDVIAPSLWAPGLKDWETDGAHSSESAEEAPETEAGPGQMSQTHVEWMVSQRKLRRREKAVPEVMKGLRALKKQYEEEQAQKNRNT
ncbi:hypothetical protein LSUE1_G000743 [Lachnellula suecica]|uniref:Uncharacterized protein n=1 Tax=Lachnellula suecica TaxID=602035 RepID=A0A8T9CG57_9HELO|nr:hypothetical protein LSUE1_G000743 [Lachnellula suecica]